MIRHGIYADYCGFSISTVELKEEKYYLHQEINVLKQVSNEIIQEKLRELSEPMQIVVNHQPDLITFLRKNNKIPIITKSIELETIESKLYSIKSWLTDGQLIINQKLVALLELDFNKLESKAVNHRIWSLIITLDNFKKPEPDEAVTGHFKKGRWYGTYSNFPHPPKPRGV